MGYMWGAIPLDAAALGLRPVSRTAATWRYVMTNVGKWTAWYQGLEEPWPYRDDRGNCLPVRRRRPDIAFRLADITDRFSPDVTYTVQQIPSATQYGCETILLLEQHPGVG